MERTSRTQREQKSDLKGGDGGERLGGAELHGGELQ
jgi:hypothetical protein